MTPSREQLITEVRTLYTRASGHGLNGKMLASPKSAEFRHRLTLDTSQLDDSYDTAARIAFILEDRITPPICENCGGLTKYNKQTQSFNRFCSRTCSITNATTVAKAHATNVERYGYINPLWSPDIQEACRATCRDRYGVDKPFQSSEIQQKKLATVAAMNVSSTALLPEVRTKQQATRQERYGVDYPFQSNEIQQKVTDTMHDVYGVERWSMANVSSSAYDILRSKSALHELHFVQQMPLNQIGEILGVSWTTVKKYFVEHGMGEPMHFFSSVGEREVADFIESLGVGHVDRNVRHLIPPKEVDIYVPAHNIAIEYCGVYWHGETQGKTRQYHRSKMLECRRRGVRLITVYDSEWINQRALIEVKLSSLFNRFSGSTVYARKCTVCELSSHVKASFLNDHHIQGNGPGSISYGLSVDDQLVAAMTFIDNKDGTYVLNRYATNCSVPGGFSKLLTHFTRKHVGWVRIVTYADLRWSAGELYETQGFQLTGESEAEYSYVMKGRTHHKRAFAPHLLPSKLPNYAPNLSEWENMQAHGYDRIWDCGKMRFELTNKQPVTVLL